MRVFHERLELPASSSLLTADVERDVVEIARTVSRSGSADLRGEVGMSWSRWDALVAAVEENRPVPFAVVE